MRQQTNTSCKQWMRAHHKNAPTPMSLSEIIKTSPPYWFDYRSRRWSKMASKRKYPGRPATRTGFVSVRSRGTRFEKIENSNWEIPRVPRRTSRADTLIGHRDPGDGFIARVRSSVDFFCVDRPVEEFARNCLNNLRFYRRKRWPPTCHLIRGNVHTHMHDTKS